MREVAQIAEAEMRPLPLTDEAHLSACLARLDANLARRHKGDADAALTLDTQIKILGKLPKAQLSFAVGQALVRCTFFPSIAELIAFAKEWKHPDQGVSDVARNMLDNEMILRRREHAKRLRYEIVSPEEIASWPAWLCDGLVSERLLSKCAECGTYAQRLGDAKDYLAFVAKEGAQA